MALDSRIEISDSDWIGVTRGLGIAFGTFILFAHLAFPNSDPPSNVYEWMIIDSPKLSLAILLILQIMLLSGVAVLFSGLIICSGVFVVSGLLPVILTYGLSKSPNEMIVPVAIEFFIASLLIWQIVAI